MPIYEYFCSRCKMEFELMRPFSEAGKEAKCPKCHSPAQKLVSAFGSKTGSYTQAAAKPFRQATEGTMKRSKISGKTRKKRTKRSQ